MSPEAAPAAYPFDPDKCPLTATIRVIGGKWKGVLWWRLSNGVGRFGELRRCLPQITKKVLTQQLREMERDGIVCRTVYSEMPARVEYSLTEYGWSLEPVIGAISEWGAAHLGRRELGTRHSELGSQESGFRSQ